MSSKEIITAGCYHIPVLLHESIDGLNVCEGGTYIDATFGGGGHSREILHRLNGTGHLYGFDQDADAEANVPSDAANFTFVRSNFQFLKRWMRYYGVEGVNGILADLGVSSHHFDDEHRGFSFRFDAPLDMRMNCRGGMTAADVLNTYAEDALSRVFTLYGELKNGRRLANTVVKQRERQPLRNVSDLLNLVQPLMGTAREKKDMAKLFQALRIEVNHEMEALENMLHAALDVLSPGGRLSILTYHSLEDRMVKNFMRSGNIDGKVEEDFYGNRLSPIQPLSNKAVVPDEAEQQRNPRSRSAKLRVGVKI